MSRRLLLETQEEGLLDALDATSKTFKTREVRAHTKTTYSQSK